MERFQEAQAAVTDKAVQHSIEEQAVRLVDGALFPIRDCFYIYSDIDQELKREPMVSPDQAGILQIINDLFLRQPERFGDVGTRTEIKKLVDAQFQAFHDKRTEIQRPIFYDNYHQLRKEKRAIVANLFSNVAGIFKQHCPDALKGISIAVVGFDAPNYVSKRTGEHRAVFTPSSKALFDMFDKVYDFYPGRNDDQFSLTAIDAKYADTKVDYVVTGNVLNDPAHSNSSHFVFLAAARMLKKGGRAIHLLGYSNHFYDLHINNPTMIALAGQKRIAALPSQHHFNGLEETRFGSQDFVLFEQSYAVDITHHTVTQIMAEGLSAKANRHDGTPFESPYIDPEAPNLPVQLRSLAALSGEQRFETLR